MGTMQDYLSRAGDKLDGMTDGVKRAYQAFRNQPASPGAPGFGGPGGDPWPSNANAGKPDPFAETPGGGAPKEPVAAPRAQAPQPGTQLKPFNPIEANAPGVPGGPTAPIEGQVTGKTVAPGVKPVEMPNLVKPSYTAGENYDFGGRVGANGEPVAPKAGLRSIGSGKLPGILAAGAEAFDPNVRNAADPTSDMSMTDRLKQGARTSLRVGGGILGGAAGTLLGAGPVTGFAGTVAGGTAGYYAGSKVADMLVGPEKQAQTEAPLRAQQPVAQAAQPTQAQAPIQTSQGAQTPQQVVDGTAVPAAGSGAFQRKGGVAQGLRTQSNAYSEVGNTNNGGDELAPLRRLAGLDAGAKPGHGGFGSIAALGAYGALDRMKSNAANLSLRDQTAKSAQALTMATKQHEWAQQDREFENKVGQQNQTQLDKEHEDAAESAVGGDTSFFKTSGDRAAAVKAKKADIVGRFNYSTADSGIDPTKMKGAQKQQLYQAMDIQDKVIKARGGIQQTLADYFGNQRVDSKNAYSFMPDETQPATRVGDTWVVKTKNGNTISLKELAGGKFNLFNSNDPVDGDMLKLIKPLIEKAKAKGQK